MNALNPRTDTTTLCGRASGALWRALLVVAGGAALGCASGASVPRFQDGAAATGGSVGGDGGGGASGAAGHAGRSGSAGQSGSAGDGSAGQGGSAGQAGSAGEGGSAGLGGVAGQGGSAGQGGAAGQSGSGGEGGGLNASAVLDDFEDGDDALPEFSGRSGYWFLFNDETATQLPSGTTFGPEAGGPGGSTHAAHTSGGSFTKWGAGLGVDLNAGSGKPLPYDLSAYRGLALSVRGSSNTSLNNVVRLAVTTSAVVGSDSGGTCTATECGDAHGLALTLGSQWQTIEVPFASLAQEGWGAVAPFDAAKVLSIEFSVGVNEPFDFWIDDLRFY